MTGLWLGAGQILRQPSLEQVRQRHPAQVAVDQLIQLPPHGIGDAALRFFTGAARLQTVHRCHTTLCKLQNFSHRARLRRTGQAVTAALAPQTPDQTGPVQHGNNALQVFHRYVLPDIILIPEIPYDIAKVCEALDRRTKQGKGFSILAVAEGAISKEVAALPKKERKAAVAAAAAKYPSVAYEVADKIKEYSGMDIRVTVPGHTQRGGSPDPYDRVISSLFGAEAVELIKNKDFGKLVVMRNNEVTAIPMEESAGKLKYVSPDDSVVKYAKRLGISFGDE